MAATTSPEHFDVLIIGAGLSGIGAGYHLQTKCPTKRFVILEGRDAIGGTWDLFRYPGVRSDSDTVHARLRFPAVVRCESDRRRSRDTRLRSRHSARVRNRSQDSLPTSRDPRRVVVRQRAMDRRYGARTRARADFFHLRFPLSVQRLLSLRPWIRTRFRRRRSLLRTNRSSATWAGKA